MDIFSKRDGPREEDTQAKRLISQNAPVIRKLADQISNGGFTKMRQEQARRREEPSPKGLIFHDMKSKAPSDTPAPYVRVSVNNRVVLTDGNNGRQLQMLGEVRGNFMRRSFALATKENGFLSPIDEETKAAIAHLEDVEITSEFSEKDLASALEACLGLK
ncbi:hypothetical protein [Tropicimonas isoalkanivorans]|uniref:Uncharacterized protein n=1 Tax=Tropicimonas isoalkanivorans TaxID=441112 RepID=A0A1I1QD06_9RHOB|nr:hypothetical protein [Tropicimonas isoalkanivorans]SFD19971.1 hypothetical protein SAMN04488094_1202 [Tropicimonas isoalkanivorans]